MTLERVDREAYNLLVILRRINKALARYQGGNDSVKGYERAQLERCIADLQALFGANPEYYAQLFGQVTELLEVLELPQPSQLSQSLQHEAEVLRTVNLTLPKRKKVSRIYRRQFAEALKTDLAQSVFASPDTFTEGIQNYINQRLEAIDSSIPMPRKLKRTRRELHLNQPFYLVSGVSLLIADIFTPTPGLQQTSLSVGSAFLTKGLG